MKKLLFILLALTLVALPLFGACAPEEEPPPPPPPEDGEEPPPPPPPPEPIELTYNLLFGSTNYHGVLVQAFADEINARTDGLVTITVYPGFALAPPPEMYDATETGISDMSLTCLAYTMGRFPACTLVDLPHGYPNGWVASHVAWDFYNEFMPDELADTHVLYFHAHGPGVVVTVEEPVYTMEDMEGLVIRATGVGAMVMEELGATPYASGMGGAYELLQKGTVDGSYEPFEPLLGWNHAEVVKYVTNCYEVGYTTMFYVGMNKDKWDSLPSDIQTIFTEVSEEWMEKHAKVWVAYDKMARDHFLTFEGRELIELSADEMARWVAAGELAKADYFAELTALGLPAAEYEEYLNERIAYWSALAPSEAECIFWVEQNVIPLVPGE